MFVQLILTLISYVIFVLYNIFTLGEFGVITSLSNSYYLYNEKKKGLGIIFSIVMIVCAGLLMPAWLDISNGSNFQFLAFLCCAMLCFVGYAPQFKSNSITSIVHNVSAISAAIFGLLWVFIVAKCWWIVITYILIFILMALCTKTLKKCYIYWLELIAFFSTYTSIIQYYFSI